MSEKCRETEAVPGNFTLEWVLTAVFEAVNGARRKRWTQRRRGCSVVRIRDGQNGNPGSNAVDVVATGGGGAALLADGTLRAWGSGYGPGHRPRDQATNKPVMVEGIRGAIVLSPNMVLMPDGSVRDFPFQPSWATPKLTNAVAIASGGPNRFALLADGQLVAWGHKRWYPNGMVTLATLGPDTARRCAARPR